jgi:hypothetical protein
MGNAGGEAGYIAARRVSLSPFGAARPAGQHAGALGIDDFIPTNSSLPKNLKVRNCPDAGHHPELPLFDQLQ